MHPSISLYWPLLSSALQYGCRAAKSPPLVLHRRQKRIYASLAACSCTLSCALHASPCAASRIISPLVGIPPPDYARYRFFLSLKRQFRDRRDMGLPFDKEMVCQQCP